MVTDEGISRFWSKVDKSGGEDACWLWIAYCNKGGYGTFRHIKKYLSHRFAWIAIFGEIPDELLVCHSCDNPPCCNPRHLFLGSNQDNVDDRNRKGRTRHGISWGEKSGQHKLTDAQVVEIRKQYSAGEKSQKQIALEFCVSKSLIQCIVSYKNRLL